MRTRLRVSHEQDIRLFTDATQLAWYAAGLLLAVIAPFVLDEYYLGELTYVIIWAIAGMGLMVLVGHTGQASLGHGAFLACGAYAQYNFLALGIPFALSLPLAGLFTALIGAAFAVPALRLSGIYLAIATLAFGVLVEDVIILMEPLTGGVEGVFMPPIMFGDFEVDRYGTPALFYALSLGVALLVTLGYANLLRAPTGRAFTAIRDSEVSARAMGVDIAVYKTLSFAVSCFITGLAGALLGHFLGAFNYEAFLIIISIQLVLMVTVGGLGSIQGAWLGAAVIGLLPQVIVLAREAVADWTGAGNVTIPGLDFGLFGLVLIGFIIFEPLGLYGRWVKIRTWFELFPLARRGLFRRQRSYLRTERLR